MSAGSVKRDRGGWMFVVDVPGPDGRRRQLRRRRAVGVKEPFATKKEAQAELTKLLNELRNGTFVRPDKATVAGYLADWLDGLPAAGRRPSTIAGYRQTIDYNVIPTLGTIELQALTATDLDRLYSALLARGLAMSTVRKVHAVLSSALNSAERKGVISRNVARVASPPAASAAKAPEMKYWTPREMRAFIDSIDGHHHYPLIRLAAMSGMRRAELCGLRWTDVDLDAGTISVKHSITAVHSKIVAGDVKTKRSRRVLDIDAATMVVLSRWRRRQLESRMLMGAGWRDTGLVFTDPTGAGWHPNTVTQAFDRLVSAKDDLVPRIRFHDLRHSHATHLLAAGVNVKVVSERLGHASVAFTLDVYSHVMPGQQADAAAAVAALVGFL